MGQNKKYYTIGDISEICNVPIKTLRYYDEIKLLVPTHRDSETNYRYYTEDQMITLYTIRKLKTYGFPLEEIKSLVYHGTVSTLGDSLSLRLKKIESEIDSLKNLHNEIEVTLSRVKRQKEFMASYNQPEDIEEVITHDPEGIAIEYIPQTNCIATRKTELNYQNAYVSVSRWFEVFDIIKKNGYHSTGPITLTYHNEPLEQFMKKDCDLEISVPIAETPTNNKNFKTMGGYKAVTTMHVGSHSKIITSHIKALKWINQNGYKVCGPISEEYIISPIDVKNEDEYLARIIIPIEGDTKKSD